MSDRTAIDPDAFDAVLTRTGVALPLDRSADRPIVPIRHLVASYARLLGDGDEMIAASYAFQSVVSGLAAPVLAGALVLGRAPQFGLADVRWTEGRWGPRVGAGAVRLADAAPGPSLDRLVRLVGELADVLRGEVRIARRLLLGNAAAALLAIVRRAGAADGVDTTVCDVLAARTVEACGRPAVAVVVELDGWRTFRRQTCCLLRFAGGRGVCDECSLLAPSDFLVAQRLVRTGLLER